MSNHHLGPQLGRRSFLVAGTAVTALGLTGLSAVPAARAATPLTDLGPAIKSVNVRVAEFGTLPDGTRAVFALSNGYPVSFNVLDLVTGASLFAIEIETATLGSWIAQAPNGDIYFAVRHPAPAAVYRYDVRSGAVEQVIARAASELVLYGGSFDSSGVLWMGSYPHAMLFSYDPATDTLTDHGSQTDDAAYIFSLGIVDDTVWYGTGPVPHLFVRDIATGERSELQPPEDLMINTDWFIGIDNRGDDVLVRLSPRGKYDTAIYHKQTGDWSPMVITGTGGSMPTPLSRDGVSFLLVENKSLVGYRTRSNRTLRTRFDRTDLPGLIADSVNSYGMSVVEVPELGLPGESVVGITTDGDLWFFDLATADTQLVRTDILATSAEAHGIGTGPDGDVYIGAYLSSGVMSRVDADTLEITPLRGPKQGDSIITAGDQIVVSSYPGAVVHVGNVTDPWQWNTNPRKILEIGRGEPYFQDRAFGLVPVGDQIAIGTIPDYGQLGGALTFLDPVSGEFTVHRNVVADQSIISLAHRDGLVYGTTSVRGGLSSTPTQQEAVLFIWDVATGAKVWETVVSPGAKNLGGLLWGPDGLVGTTSTGDLFVFDPDGRQVIDLVPVIPAAPNNVGWGYSARTVYDEATDSYLATQSGVLVQTRRGTTTAEVLSDDMQQITQAGNGTIIGVDDTHAWLISPK